MMNRNTIEEIEKLNAESKKLTRWSLWIATVASIITVFNVIVIAIKIYLR